jgi:N-acetylmuramoyl-L-alanine amidase
MPFGFFSRDSRASGSRLKRHLLSGAVDDNLRAMRNQPRGRLHRRSPVSWPLVVAVAALGLASAAIWLVLGRAGSEAPAAARGVPLGPPAGDLGPYAAEPASIPARVSNEVFPLSVRRVVIDPGHGGGDHGTRTPLGLTEKELTLDIARRTSTRLAEAGFQVELTRDTDRRISLRDRALAANERRADVFVSIHVNWFEDGRANRGIETYYLGPSDDPFVTQLAKRENLESGYAIADVRRLLDSIYADLRQEQSRALAGSVQRRLVGAAREVAPEVADRGVKSAPFLVLVATEMPAILAEVASVANDEEARLIGDESYRERIAVALSDGIRAYSDSVARSAASPEAR